MEHLLAKYKGHFGVKKKTAQTWSGVEVVDYFKTLFDIPDNGAYGYSSWLRRVKNASMSLEQAKQVAEIMKARERWVKQTTGEAMHRGRWMFNRFRYDFREMSVDKFISKNK